MKLFVSTISLIFFWSTNDESPKCRKDMVNRTANTVVEKNWNKDYHGLWVNEEGGLTRMITKCEISYRSNSFIVQIWGACQPQDCDWGESVVSKMKKGTDKFELIWDQEFAESAITYEIIDGKLKLKHIRRYKDNSGRSDSTLIEYFIRQ